MTTEQNALPSQPIATATTNTTPNSVVNVTVKCACNEEMTIEQLVRAYKHRTKKHLSKFLPHLITTMNNYTINTCLRKAHFLAQVGHESSELQYVAELGVPDTAYNGFKGRGLIQITFEKNYKRYGNHVSQDFTSNDKNKKKLEEEKWATDSAGWFWIYGSSQNLNTLADKNDLIYITYLINGGFNGYNHRNELLKIASDALLLAACDKDADVEFGQFKFKNSGAYSVSDAAFAWGYWSDEASKRKGLTKDKEQAKLGYERFLAINNRPDIKDGRYGFDTFGDMVKHAKKRLEELKK